MNETKKLALTDFIMSLINLLLIYFVFFQPIVYAKNLQQLNLLIDYLESLFPAESGMSSGKVIDYSLPKIIGSKPFRTGKLYPFVLISELHSLDELFELIYKLYAFQEVDMWIFPNNENALEIWEKIDNIESTNPVRIYNTKFNLFLYEGEPEAGFDSYSLWERPFKLIFFFLDEKYILQFVHKAIKYKKIGFRLELSKEFESSQTNYIHYSGNLYIKSVYNLFVVPEEPFIHKRREKNIWFPDNFFDKFGNSPWALNGCLFGALEKLLDEPRLYKGWLLPKENIKSKVWFETIITKSFENSYVMKVIGKANDINELIEFIKDTKNSGWFNKVEIKYYNAYYDFKIDRYIVDFEIDLYY